MANAVELVGRSDEFALLHRTLKKTDAGATFALVEGEAGIGKTVLLRTVAAAGAASGFKVLSATAGEIERELPYVALGDLLEHVADEALSLPPPQRDALDAILLRRSLDRAVEPRTVGAMLLGCVRLLAARSPVLLLIDDVQWVDASSLLALRYACRRLDQEPVAVIVARRTESGLSDTPSTHVPREADDGRLGGVDRTKTVKLGPLDEAVLSTILRRRGVGPLPPPRLRQLADLSGGNALLALALVEAGEPMAMEPDVVAPPAHVERIVRARFDRQPPDVRRVLLGAATLRRPRRELLARLAGAGRAAHAIDEATTANLLALHPDRLEFRHPLIRSAILSSVSSAERAAVHLEVSAVVDDVDERAFHLAMGSAAPDAAIAALIDASSRRVGLRGAPAESSVLSERAARLTPASAASLRAERLLVAAESAFAAGDTARATGLLAEVIQEALEADLRARAMLVVARIEAATQSLEVSLDTMQKALALAVDPATRAQVLTQMADIGRFVVGMPAASAWAEEAVRLGELADDPKVLSPALAAAGLLAFNVTGQVQEDRMRRAIALDQANSSIASSAAMSLAHQLIWAGRLREARPILESQISAGVAEGTPADADPLWYVALLEWLAGRWDLARIAADRELRLREQAGWELAGSLWISALLDTSMGHVARGRRTAERGLDVSRSTGQQPWRRLCLWVIGQADLLQGISARPSDETLALFDAATGALPATLLIMPDLVELLVRTGELDEAEARLGTIEQQAAELNHPFGWPASQRARAALLMARNEHEAALRALEAWSDPRTLEDFPFFSARMAFQRGQLLRRTRRRAAAAQSLEQAQGLFAAIGATPWAALVARELELLGRKRASVPDELSAAEMRVASLAATGRTNREIAAELVLSPKTVEWTLTRVYAKLGLRSRAELARSFSEGPAAR